MKRHWVSLLTASTFLVLSVSGILAFLRPFSIGIVGLHSLMGFVFIALVALHIGKNRGHLNRYIRRRSLWIILFLTTLLSAVFVWQPDPVKALLGLSKNLGPAIDQFEVTEEGITYYYNPAPDYRLKLSIRTGSGFDPDNPPHLAVWLENASFYHIKTLHEPEGDGGSQLPYWRFKRDGWEEAKREAEAAGQSDGDVDAVSAPTQNSSFDPGDYLLPNPESPMTYQVMIEIKAAEESGGAEEAPSLIYKVEIDNADPYVYQLLELVGYPKKIEETEGEEEWAIYYYDEPMSPALELIDSALLTIERVSKN
ncbi:DUF4405 domain-containing protein [Verrucomicrobiales bacterium BCK34]|nr:DUF4405 domain-containing protein [Verrucomicrobiales bacterium BCK34]